MTEQGACSRLYIRKSRMLEALLEVILTTAWAIIVTAVALYTRDPALSFIAGFALAIWMATTIYWCTR